MTKLTIKEINNSQWNYSEVENHLLNYIKSNDKLECSEIIRKYENTIKKHFESNEKEKYVKEFVKKLNEILVNNSNYSKEFAAEEVLKCDVFPKEIISEFNESDILLRALQKKNYYLTRKLLNKRYINLNCFTCDENGETALMHAAKHWENVFVVEKLLSLDRDSLFIEDNEGNTALYHSIHNFNIFNRILFVTKDINHLNHNNETIIYYCGRNEIYIPFDIVFKIPNIDLKFNKDIFIDEGKRKFIELVQNDNDTLLKYLSSHYQSISNFTNTDILKSIVDEIGITMITILIEKYYNAYMSNDKDSFPKLIRMLKLLIFHLKCDVNTVIDEEGNTPIMFFLLIENYPAVNYILSCKDVDLSIKNKHGINASYLSLFIEEKEKKLRMKFLEHPTFDHFYLDQQKDNLITHFIIRDCYDEALQVVTKAKYLLTVPNENGENTITIAIKSGHSDILQDIFFQNEAFNQQDRLGNTPLHYAIELKDKYAILILAFYGADTSIKNNKGQTALDLANEANDEDILECLNNPNKILKKKQSKFKKVFSKIKKGTSSNEASSSESSSTSINVNDASNEKFDVTLIKNKDMFKNSNKNISLYREDYNYLLKRTKTLYSLSNHRDDLIQVLKNAFLLNKPIFIKHITFEWAFYLTMSAYCLGYDIKSNKPVSDGAYYTHSTKKSGDFNPNIDCLEIMEYSNGSGYEFTEYKNCDGYSQFMS